MSVVSMIVGAPTPDGATFACKVNGGGPVRVAVSTDDLFISPVFTSSQAVDAQGVAKVSVTGLVAGTRYWWRTEDNAVMDETVTGQLVTAPVAGSAASFTIGCAGDAGLNPLVPGTGAVLDATGQRVSNHPVFDTLVSRALAEDWLSFVHLGDLHYYDLGDAFPGTTANYRQAYDDVLAQPLQHQLYRSLPLAYAWDDHDYGPNNSDGTLATKANAATAYRERVPHFPLIDAAATYHSWEWGRVLFVLSDIRYDRSPNSDPDGPTKTMLGTAQKTWLEGVLTASTAKLLVWINPQQWLGTATDSWASFATERAELVTMFGDTGWLGRMLILSADYHGVALDTGVNSAGSIPVLHASALDATPGAGAGGTYDRGSFDGRDQYGTLEVADLGQALRVTMTGWQGTDVLVRYAFSVPGDPLPAAATGALLRTLRGSHRMTVEARLLTTFQTGEDPDGDQIQIFGGDVVMDATAKVERQGSLTTRGQDAWPRVGDTRFAPYGNEVFLRRGVDLGSGVLWVPLGYYRIETSDQDDAPRGQMTLTLFDRMKGIVDARLMSPRTYRPTTPVSVVFEDLVGEIYPDVVIAFDDSSGTRSLGRELLVEEDRHAGLLDVADGLGKVMHFDDVGIFRVEDPPPTDVAAWEVRAGHGGVLVNAGRQITREGVYNAVVATGEGSDDVAPVRGVAIDANPLSPTFFGGRFGQVPRFYSSPFLTTEAQAQAAAVSILRRSVGLPYNVKFDAVVNPALRPYQAIMIRYKDGNMENHVVDRLTIPLVEGAFMSGSTREQTLVIVQVMP